MYKNIISRLLAILVISALGQSTYSQAIYSPYTAIGIGEIYSPALSHNQGTGGLGISNSYFWNINNINPALLPYNSLSAFSAGFIGENNTISDGIQSEKKSGGNLNYLIIALPIVRGKWTTAIGLTPYSSVNYNFAYTDQVIGSSDIVVIEESGSGGFNQVYWSNGYAINKNLSLGIKASHMFGAIEKNFANTIQNVGNVYTPTVNDRLSVSDFNFSLGLAYNIDSVFNSPNKLKIGVTYDLAADIKTKKFQTFERSVGINPPLDADTLQNSVGRIYLPEAIGVGISLNQSYNWMVGVDFKYRPWSQFVDYSGQTNILGDSYQVILGGEWVPDAGSVSSYFKRITYKLGFMYEETPYVFYVNGKKNQVKDFGINFGWSLPTGRYSGIDMGFRIGKRGNFSETILEENYYRIYLGVSFNDQWFIKRKYD